MKRIGLVFAGGGGKGAYQIGVWKYLHEQGIDRYVRSVSGTSVGALNAALFVGGNYQKSQRIWKTIRPNQVITPKSISETLKSSVSILLPISSLIGNQPYYFSRSGIIELIHEGVDFSKIRKSQISCFVTCLPYPFPNPLPTVKRFQLNNYDNETGTKILLASSAIPYVFKPEKIKGRLYLDGGTPPLGDNVPIQPVYETGVDTIIVVHLDQDKQVDKTKYPNSRIIEIVPQDDLGGITNGMLDFKSENAVWRMERGYLDARRYLK